MPYWLQVLQGLLTPLIALITTYIAWQQWRAAELKINMDRYERRLAIYQATHRFISSVIQTAKPDINEMFGFYAATAEADFLFPDEVRQYLDAAFSHANHLHTANLQYCDYTMEPPPNYNHRQVVDTMHENLTWFTEQPAAAKALFKKYLSITA
ncbi:hypothetical protein [Geothrix paludis]|uniref:hypothetical protein n=1 Tax=Geothrix paludis TaxID=2922722 RepID=UPI001FADD2DA|nr:hypothetical protein [Geothrix paludis]